MFNVNKISELLKDTAEQVPEDATFFISKYLKFGEKNRPFAKNNTKFLFDRSGDLYRSLQTGDVNNITNINYRPDGIAIEYGTKIPYGEVHEKGMFIESKGKMHKYFFAKYYETLNENYKFVAFSVLRNGGVNIPKRPFFSTGLKDFENEGLPEIMKNMLNKLLNIINE